MKNGVSGNYNFWVGKDKGFYLKLIDKCRPNKNKCKTSQEVNSAQNILM